LLELEARVNPVTFEYAVAVPAGNTTETKAVATDAAGNVYTAGTFFSTQDMDPGPGVTNLTSAGNSDWYIAKYTPAGALVWAGAIDVTDVTGIAVDAAGNVHVAGTIFGSADVNPGPGVNVLDGAGVWDGFLLKLNAAGNYMWAKAFGGTGEDFGTGVAVDAAGNVATVGHFRGSANISPTGGFNLTSAGGDDAYMIRLDAAGTVQTAKRWGGIEHDRALAVAVDAAGNAVATGTFENTVDLDPGPATLNRTAQFTDGFVSKFDAAGNLTWARAVGQHSLTSGLTPTAVALDAAGNVHVTGDVLGTADFDGGGETALLSSAGGFTAFVLKMNAAGHYVWAQKATSFGQSSGTDIAVDADGGIYTSGYFAGAPDFDPAAGVQGASVRTADGFKDAYVLKWTAAGDFAWVGQIGGGGQDEGKGIAVDRRGAVYTTGEFTADADLDPIGEGPVVQPNGTHDGFLVKLSQPVISGVMWDDDDGDGVRDGAEPRMAGAVAELRTADGATLGARATNAAGEYLFIDVPESPSGYQVQFRLPEGYGFTGQDAGGDDGVDSDAHSTSGLTAAFTLVNGAAAQDAGGTGAAAPFGFVATVKADFDAEATALVTDAAGFVYVAGRFFGAQDFDPSDFTAFALAAAGGSDAYVAKYTPAGALMWARGFGGATDDEALGLAVDSQGIVYTTGSYTGTPDFDPDPAASFSIYTSAGGRDGFLHKLDAAGKFMWVKRFHGPEDQVGRAVAVDAANTTYVTGSISGTTEYHNAVPISTGAGRDAAFVWKNSQEGFERWHRELTGSGTSVAAGIAVDAQGSVVVAGSFTGSVDFNPSPTVSEVLFAPNGQPDAFVSKLASNGNYAWAKQLGGAAADAAAGVAVDAAGNVYATGYFTGVANLTAVNVASKGGKDAFVAKLTSAGQHAWAKPFGSANDDAGRAVVVTPAGTVLTAGEFAAALDFDPGPDAAVRAPYQSSAVADVYVSELSAAGDFVAVRTVGGPQVDTAAGVAATAAGDALVAGAFHSAADFDPSNATYLRNTGDTGGSGDGFVVKMSPAAVRGTVWHDVNGNGVRNAGDDPVAGVVVELADSLGDLLRQVVTGADGAYAFLALPDATPGAYAVRVRASVGFNVTQAGSDNDFDPATGQTPGFGLAAHETAVKDAGLAGAAPAFGFAAPVNAVNGSIESRSVVTDAAGNVYATGNFSRTADFDPSAGTYTLTTGADTAAYVAKYTAAGALVWAKEFGSDTGAGSADGRGAGLRSG